MVSSRLLSIQLPLLLRPRRNRTLPLPVILIPRLYFPRPPALCRTLFSRRCHSRNLTPRGLPLPIPDLCHPLCPHQSAFPRRLPLLHLPRRSHAPHPCRGLLLDAVLSWHNYRPRFRPTHGIPCSLFLPCSIRHLALCFYSRPPALRSATPL